MFVEGGSWLPDVTLPGDEVYVAALLTGRIHRLTVASGDTLTPVDSVRRANLCASRSARMASRCSPRDVATRSSSVRRIA